MTDSRKKVTPPEWANRFLKWFCSEELLEEIQGDLHEAFKYRYKTKGIKKAKMLYVFDVLRFFRPYAFKNIFPSIKSIRFAMIKNYLKISFRNIKKDYFYSGINIIGLAIGIAISLLIFRFVQFELSFDKFHLNKDRIFRIKKEIRSNEYDTHVGVMTPYILGDLLSNDLHEYKIAQISRIERVVSYNDKSFIEDEIYLANPEILEVFTFEFLKGDPETALDEPSDIILTEETAKKYFGDQNPMGETIIINEDQNYMVSGIVRKFPQNSHWHFDFIASLESTRNFYPDQMFEHWGNTWMWTYVLVPQGIPQEELDYLILDNFSRYVQGQPFADKVKYYTQKLSDIHLHSNYGDELETNGSYLMVNGSIISAIIILLIACFNFMNLTTARFTQKTKEVSVRKAIGANRINLIVQFLVESLVITFMASLIAVSFAELFAPVFKLLLGNNIPLGWQNSPQEFYFILGGTVIVSIMAGSYPAFYLSKFSPARILNPQSKSKSSFKPSNVRKGLVILQLAASIILMTTTVVVYRQVEFMQNKELGFDKENVLIVELENNEAREKIEFLKETFRQIQWTQDISTASQVPSDRLNSWRIKPENTPNVEQNLIKVVAGDYNYTEILNLEIIEGRNFSKEFATDQEEAIILNQSAVEALGLDNPVGKEFLLHDGRDKVKVIGVVKDFHLTSLHEEITPLMITLHPSWYNKLLIKTKPGKMSNMIASYEKSWEKVFPDQPFEFYFLDEKLNQQYDRESKLGSAFFYFSILAIFIACLGLFGLASFTTERRVKEVGIRKAFGATIIQIIPLLIKDFLILALFSLIISIPVSWFMLQEWLRNFTFHISLDWKVYMLTGLLALVIAVITISYHSVKAALTNPVESLRYE